MKKLFPLLILIILFVWGCGKSEKKEEITQIKETPIKEAVQTNTQDRIVARVNGRPIYEKDLRGRFLKDVIDYEILYEAGLKQGLDKKVEKAVEDYKKRLIVNTLEKEFMDNLPKGGEVSNKEIEDYYKENESKYTLLHLKEITLDDKKLAEEIHKRALNGEDFEKIASDYSQSGRNINVRDLELNRKYNDLFTGKAIGSVSDVIQEGNRFKILKLVEVRRFPLDKVKESIKYIILAQRRAKAMHEFIDKIKNEDKIKVEILEEKK